MKLEQLIDKYYDKLTENDKYICEAILNHKKDCIHMSIDEFAQHYHISTSTLSRFAQKLKLGGYSELRVVLKMGENSKQEIQETDYIFDCYHSMINDIEKKDCQDLFSRMNQDNRIIIYGSGSHQSRVAREMKRIFLPIGKKLYDVSDYDVVDQLLQFVKEDDIVFLLSLSGESQHTLKLAKELKMRHIYCVSITKMESNTLSRICHENLYIQSTHVPVYENMEYHLITPYFILIELLYIKYKKYLETEHIPKN